MKDRRLLWIYLGAVTLLLRLLSPASWVESVYSRGIFMVIRWVVDYTLGWIHIPLSYPFLVLFFLWLIREIARSFLRPKLGLKSIHIFIDFAKTIGAIAGFLFFWLMWLWGFNYARVDFAEQTSLKAGTLATSDFEQELVLAQKELIEQRKHFHRSDTIILTDTILPDDLEYTIRRKMVQVLLDLGYPTPGAVRVRPLFPGMLMRLGISGIYNPFMAEGTYDGGLHPIAEPFTLAHEMAHGYGITDEGDCNFLAWLVCRTSGEPFLEYSAAFTHWKYAFSECVAHGGGALADSLKRQLPEKIKLDLAAYRKQHDKYNEILPGVAEKVNNAYLVSNGVSGGINNYDRMVGTVIAWRKKQAE